ncbi:hypothetical protein [Micromonospora aurantiaca (nom. illeg.)]|uniref:hypothetical protein n=1 Tax=Micromonospora aurantiaca (nom. illeg.) TaxID=47850 RepID=UPI0011A6F630|nr:hypothetical protein [Micromonospora aurantiaca]MBC9000529.1 hypothetical protein [Micromonospora aurantiaca]
MPEIGRAPATMPGPGRTQRPTSTINPFSVATILAFGAMVTLLAVALVQRHTPGGNPDGAFAGAVGALLIAVVAGIISDRRTKVTR